MTRAVPGEHISAAFANLSTRFRPSAIATEIEARSTLRFPSDMVGHPMVDELPRDGSLDDAKDDGSTARTSGVTLSDETPQNVPVGIDRTIDDLLVLTQEPVSPTREKQALAHLQMLVPFREKLRQRLEEVPDSLGPSTISSHVLRVAYTEHSRLNWVMFGSLPPRMIAAVVASDELRNASALSLCVDAWAGDGGEGASELVDLAAALAQSTGLQQLCFLQRPDRAPDDVSAHFCSRLLRLWGRASGGEDWQWLMSKTIHSTSAFLTGLRSRKFLTSPSMIASGSSSPSGAPVFPMIHLFTFFGPQCDDIPDAAADHHVPPARPGYSAYYTMDNTGFTAEKVAVRFLDYLRALGPYSDPDKAILRMAYHGAFPSLASTADDNEQHRRQHGWSPPRRRPPPPPLRPSPDPLGVRPIPAGFFDEIAPDDPSRVRLGAIPPGGWVVLVDRRVRRGRASDDTAFLRYSFLRVRQSGAELPPEQQSRPVEMVGGLTDFLRETAPGTDLAAWETRVEQVERDLVSEFTRSSPPSTPSSPDLTTMMERADETFRRLAEASTGMSASTPPPDMDRPTWEKKMQEVYRALASYKPPTNPLSALGESDVPDEEQVVECCVDVGVMAESRVSTLLDQLV